MPDRVPTADQLRLVVAALQGFFDLSRRRINDAREQERRVFVWYAELADAIRPTTSATAPAVGWSHSVGQALSIAVEAHVSLGDLWGCREVAQPEPGRAAFLAERERRFYEDYERPMVRAAIAWQDHDKGRSCPAEVHAIADRGRGAGETASVSAEKGERAYRDAVKRLHAALWERGEKLIFHGEDFGSTEKLAAIEALRVDLDRAYLLLLTALKDAGEDREPAPQPAEGTAFEFGTPPEGVEINSFSPEMVAFYRREAKARYRAIDDLKSRSLVTTDRAELERIHQRIEQHRHQLASWRMMLDRQGIDLGVGADWIATADPPLATPPPRDRSPAADPPRVLGGKTEPPTDRIGKPADPLTLDDRAVALLTRWIKDGRPRLSRRKLAEALGCHHSSLRDCPTFMTLWASHQSQLNRGYHDRKTGRIEAIHDRD